MKSLDGLLGLVITIGLAALSGCGGISYGYDTSSVRTLPGVEHMHASTTEALDARVAGASRASVGAELDEGELRDVRQSVRRHLESGGIVSADTPTLAAPTTAAEVESVLATAAAQGATEVVFVRYYGTGVHAGCGNFGATAAVGILLWLILESIPLWRHGAYAAFEVMAVSTQTHELLARSVRVASFGEHVSSWGCGADGVMRDMELRAMEAALRDVVSQAASGWPARTMVADVGAEVVSGSMGRRTGDHVTGPGYALDIPADWRVHPADPRSLIQGVIYDGPDGMTAIVEISGADEDQDWPQNFASVFRGVPSYANERLIELGEERTAIQFEMTGSLPPGDPRLPQGGEVRIFMRAMASDGMGVLIRCLAPAAAAAAHQGECERIVESGVLTDELISDERRHDPS